jgi:hypothetical protein
VGNDRGFRADSALLTPALFAIETIARMPNQTLA